MMKRLLIVIGLMFCFGVTAEEITIEVPDLKMGNYVDDYVYVHKNVEQIDDPKWVDPEDGTKAPKVNKYTDEEWMVEHIAKYITGQVKRGKKAKVRDGYEAVPVTDITAKKKG